MFIWNPSHCGCGRDKSYDLGQYLDYKNCKCRKKLVGELVQKCIKGIDGNDMIYNETVHDYKKKCSPCTIYIVLFAIFLIISINIFSVFIFFHWYLKKK